MFALELGVCSREDRILVHGGGSSEKLPTRVNMMWTIKMVFRYVYCKIRNIHHIQGVHDVQLNYSLVSLEMQREIREQALTKC